MTIAQAVEVWDREELLTGCQAVSHAVKLADVDVIAAYPIRPYTEVMDLLSKLIADGELDSEYIVADSEHSQFEIVKHASSVGARAFAGSSGTGWMYGFEALVVTATDRLPPLFLVGNRALDDPGAFGVEHNDAMALRDMGWLLCWASTAQEALEHVFIGYRIAEDKRVRMPMALAMDGAFLTHSQHMVKVPTEDAVSRFLPPYDLGARRMHPDNPVSIAPQVNEDWVMELRRQNWEAARRARHVIKEAYQEFNAIFGQRYDNPYFSEFMTEDAEAVLIGIGAVCHADADRVPASAGAGAQGRLCQPALVPAVPHRGAARLPRPVQGRGGHRSRLRARIARQWRDSHARGAVLPLSFARTPERHQLHGRPRWTRHLDRGMHQDVRGDDGRRAGRHAGGDRQLDGSARVVCSE